MVKNTSCLYRGPRFDPQNPHQAAHHSLELQLREIQLLLPAFVDTHIYVYIYIHTDIHIYI